MLIYLAVIWYADKNDREPIKLVLINFLWGAIGAVIIASISSFILLTEYSSLISNKGLQKLTGTLFIAPFVEELAKGCFLFLTINNKKFDNLTDGLVYGGAIGLGFGMTENFLYFISFGTTFTSWITIVIIRTLFSAVMHFLSTATFGGFLSFSKFKSFPIKIILSIAGLSSAMLIHFIWNLTVSFGVTIILGFLFLFFSVLIFITVFALSIRAENNLIYYEMMEEVANNLFPAEHLEVFRNKKQDSVGWIDENIKSKYLKLITTLAFRKMQLNKSTDYKKKNPFG